MNLQTLPFLHPGLFQICYVTRDLDRGMQQLAAAHGIDRFRIKRNVAALPGMPAMTMHQAHVFVGELQVELIQPAGGDDSVYREFCASDGSLRHHHFGLWVDDRADYDAIRARCRARGVPIAFEIAVPDVGGAIYADFRGTLGHYLEYIHLSPQVKAHYYADVPRCSASMPSVTSGCAASTSNRASANAAAQRTSIIPISIRSTRSQARSECR